MCVWGGGGGGGGGGDKINTCVCGEGMGTKKKLTCGCRGMKVIHFYDGETKEFVHECQWGQTINTCVYAVNQGIKMCVCVCGGGPRN